MGIIKGMSNEVYHSQSGISSTTVKTVYKKSLAHWKGAKRSQTSAFALGSAYHANCLEPERDLVIKGPKTRSSKAFKEMEDNLQEDQILVTEVEYHVAKRMAEGTMNDPASRAALEHPDRLNEVAVFAECPRTGLMLKTKPDTMSGGTVYDLKSTIDSSPSGFARECQKYAYDIQAAFYLYVCSLVEDLDPAPVEFSFISCEKSAPYISHMHIVGPELLENATQRMHKTLSIIASAQKEENYGTGWGEYSILELPKWL